MWVAWAAPTSWIRSSEDPENARPFNEAGRFPQVLAALTEVSFDDIDTNKDGVITPEDQDLRYRDSRYDFVMVQDLYIQDSRRSWTHAA